jgi:hypothetical protein
VGNPQMGTASTAKRISKGKEQPHWAARQLKLKIQVQAFVQLTERAVATGAKDFIALRQTLSYR